MNQNGREVGPGRDLPPYDLWRRAVGQVEAEYANLSPALKERCCGLLQVVGDLKAEMARLVEAAGGADQCRGCGGVCCERGANHFTVPDLLAHLCRGIPLFAPRFHQFPQCPYLGQGGCLMPPDLRPFNCIIFNCEHIEGRMPQQELQLLHDLEGRLRDRYAELDILLGNRFMHGLLITYEREVLRQGRRLLRPSPPTGQSR